MNGCQQIFNDNRLAANKQNNQKKVKTHKKTYKKLVKTPKLKIIYKKCKKVLKKTFSSAMIQT